VDFRKWALSYLRIGMHPLPIEPRGKKPLVGWKEYQDRPPSSEEIEAWAARWPEANIGIIMGRGLLAVDADGEWPVCQELLGAAGIILPDDAPVSLTGKGRHIILSADGPISDAVGLLRADGAAIDIRGVGYIVAPPSVHESGRQYNWMMPPKPGVAPPRAPRELLALMNRGYRETLHGAVWPAWVQELMAGVSEGGRNAACARLAGYFLTTGMEPGAVEMLLAGWASRCSPTFPMNEVLTTVRSIAAREARKPRDESQELPPLGDTDFPSLQEVMDLVWQDIMNGGARFQPFPWDELNELLGGGIAYGEMMLLAAPPGVGKTAMCLLAAMHAAQRGQRVLFVSREMPVRAIGRRLLAQGANLDSRLLRGGKEKFQPGELVRAETVKDHLGQFPLSITSAIRSVEQLAMAVRDRGPWDIVFVDYLQIMRSEDGSEDRRIEVERIAQGLREIANAGVPLVAISSMSRGQDNKPPELNRLRESGELEYSADIVGFLWQPDEEDRSHVRLALKKVREGEVADVHFTHTAKYLQFRPRASTAF